MKFPGLVQVVNLLAVATMSTEVSAQTPPPVDKWPSLGGRIVTPNSEGWSAATDRWNAYGAPTFAAAVVPKNANEVALAVKGAALGNIPFLAMGGRHGYGTTFAELQKGLAIDLSNLNKVTVDKNAQTVTIGAAAKIKDVINPVADAGFQIGSGACNCAGYTGTALGAGIGYLQGTFGLVADNMVSADVVLADGKQVKVSKDSNSDLFWALRGAGGNFGVVTSSTYKLSKPINGGKVFHLELMYSAAQQEEYFKVMEAFRAKQPAALGFSSTLAWNPPANEVAMISTFIFVGSEADGRTLLKPFLDLEPLELVTEEIPFQTVPTVAITGIAEASCYTVNGLHSIHTVNLRQWPAKTMSSIFEQFNKYMKDNTLARDANSAIIIESFGVPAKIAGADTAYPWKDASSYIMLQMRWPNLGDSFGETANKFAIKLRDELAAASGYGGLAAYVNYAWGDEKQEEIYGKDKLGRLRELKKKYDPKNRFRFNNPISA